MKRTALVVLLLLLVRTGIGQDRSDSLRRIWEDGTRPDTTRLVALKHLIRERILFTAPDSALGLARMLYDTAVHMGVEAGMSAALNIQGIVMAMQGEHAAAIGLYERALELGRKAGDVEGQVSAMKNIGGSHFMMGQAFDGLTFMERALELSRGSGDRLEANLLSSMALTYTKMDMYGKADECARRALAIADSLGDQQEIQYALTALGDNLMRQGDLDPALPYYQRALAIAEQVGDQRRIGAALEGLSSLYARRGQHDQAIAMARRRLGIAEAILDRASMEQGYLNLYDVYQLAGRIPEALEMLERYTELHDVIRSDENKAALLRQKIQFDFDLKEAALRAEQEKKDLIAAAEIRRQKAMRHVYLGGALVLLVGAVIFFQLDRRRRRERFQKEAAELQTQALRAQMNPHFIFNALNSINAYVQRNNADGASSFLSKFARVMRGVLENSRHREVPLKDDLETLRGYMELERKRTDDKFDFTITVAPAIDPEQVMVPPLVVQPLVENAIWHGIAPKEGHGHIRLQVELRNERLIWTIDDDGVGRAAARPAKDPAAMKTSLGTAITRSRLELLQQQVGGRAGFHYEDLPQGTRVVVDMPLIQA